MKKLMVAALAALGIAGAARAGSEGSVVLENEYGRCEIALRGAYVVSCAFKGDEHPLVYVPRRGHDFDPRAIKGCPFVHGGIPLLWPWFGGTGAPKKPFWCLSSHWQPPFHGPARYSLFTADAPVTEKGGTSVTLHLRPCAETEKWFPHSFALDYKITLGDHSLTLSTTTRNAGDREFRFRSGYHPYFAVSESYATRMDGFEGRPYESTRDLPCDLDHIWHGKLPVWPGCDLFKFDGPHSKVTLEDPQWKRAIVLETFGGKDVVTWIQDAGDPKKWDIVNIDRDEFNRYVCIEPSNFYDRSEVKLAPGQAHTLTTAISVRDL